MDAKPAERAAGRSDDAHQFSTCTAGNGSKCLVLRVTTVQLCVRAMAAMRFRRLDSRRGWCVKRPLMAVSIVAKNESSASSHPLASATCFAADASSGGMSTAIGFPRRVIVTCSLP
jgi:hypothetical protein